VEGKSFCFYFLAAFQNAIPAFLFRFSTKIHFYKSIKGLFEGRLLTLLAMSFCVYVNACSDSTVRNSIDTTLFNTDFEKTAFSQYLNDRIGNPLMMLMSINANSSNEEFLRVEKTINSLTNNLLQKTEKQKQLSKTYKIIFDDIHSAFLNHYNLVADFEKIFIDGTYNCVSASALYSLILTKMKIHHAIRETVDHVYVIVDPDNTHFLFETTDPSGGYWKIDDPFKKNYIDFLIKQKIITQAELNSSTVGQVFEKYYYRDEAINVFQLAGLQYYNQGVEALTKSDESGALKSFEKAYILYPSERILFFINNCLAIQVEERTDYNQQSVTAIMKLLNYNDSDFFNSQAINFFELICENVLIKKNNSGEFERLYKLFNSGIQDDSIKQEITSLYYTYKGIALYYKSSYRDALPILKQAYDMQQEDLRLQAIISESVLRLASFPSDPEKTIKTLDEYVAGFSFLKTYKLINDAYAKMYLGLAGNYFQINDKKNGLLYLSKIHHLQCGNT